MDSTESQPTDTPHAGMSRPQMDVDIVCVGFGPGVGGFLTTLSKRLLKEDGTPAFESAVAQGMPPQVVCYERADDLGFGVSGVVTRGRSIRASLPQMESAGIPMATPVREEKVVYLLDPIGASRRSLAMRAADALIRATRWILPFEKEAVTLPWVPGFLHKKGGMILSLGQFMQWLGVEVQSKGTVQIWPGIPVTEAVLEQNTVVGVRLADQGVDRSGKPIEGYAPGLDVRAALTVVGDGPVGAIGQQLDRHFGMPAEHHVRDWAVGMKFVVDLPPDSKLQPGTVFHTLGYPEPEIFGFLYVHPDRVASLGIFVPSWFDNPVRTAYRYLQHWMLHPWLWQYLQGARLRSWGAKSIRESGRRGEPFLVGDGFARVGEGSGSTNVLTNSGVDEAWATGVDLAEAVLQLLAEKKSFSRANLEETYVRRRRASWVEKEGSIAERSRDGFQLGLIPGMLGMVATAITGGRFSLFPEPVAPHKRIRPFNHYFEGKVSKEEIARLRNECATEGKSLHNALMDRCGWPAIPFDGKLLVSHQDALLLGGKVQAPSGYADHVVVLYPELCEQCGTKVCIELCSGQALVAGPSGVPNFDREKCIHCGACLWNCAQPIPGNNEVTNISFRAGPGGLHSVEN